MFYVKIHDLYLENTYKLTKIFIVTYVRKTVRNCEYNCTFLRHSFQLREHNMLHICQQPTYTNTFKYYFNSFIMWWKRHSAYESH